MMHLCQALFPTIQNEEEKIIEMLDSTFRKTFDKNLSIYT